MLDIIDISVLKGKILKRVVVNDDEILFVTDNKETYKMYHSQECCEYVGVEEIIGFISDLLNNPILEAEEVSNNKYDGARSETWTFYKLGTIKGSVTIRWYGSSNGYYSERVSFVEVKN